MQVPSKIIIKRLGYFSQLHHSAGLSSKCWCTSVSQKREKDRYIDSKTNKQTETVLWALDNFHKVLNYYNVLAIFFETLQFPQIYLFTSWSVFCRTQHGAPRVFPSHQGEPLSPLCHDPLQFLMPHSLWWINAGWWWRISLCQGNRHYGAVIEDRSTEAVVYTVSLV